MEHKHIIKLYNYSVNGIKTMSFILEYAKGGTLKSKLLIKFRLFKGKWQVKRTRRQSYLHSNDKRNQLFSFERCNSQRLET